MKPTSIIFLVVAVILVAVGFSLAGSARGIAEANGIMIRNEKVEDSEDTFYRQSFSDEDIVKITLSATDAEICIYGNAEESYIELINYADGTYTLTNDHTVTFSDTLGEISLDNIENIFGRVKSFQGLHGFLNYLNTHKGDKKINLYLSAKSSVNSIVCSTETGSITFDGKKLRADSHFELKNGKLTLKNIVGSSAVSVDMDDGEVSLTGCSPYQLEINAKKGSVTTNGCDIFNAKINVGEGSVNLQYVFTIPSSLILKAPDGRISIYGKEVGDTYGAPSEDAVNLLDVTVEHGNISLDALADSH